MFSKIASLGAMLALVVSVTAAGAAPRKTAQAAPNCCVTRTRCCDKVEFCCDQPEKAQCCKTGTPCCDMADCCGSGAKTARAQSPKRARKVAVRKSTSAPACCKKGHASARS
jgi:hypothetical protein